MGRSIGRVIAVALAWTPHAAFAQDNAPNYSAIIDRFMALERVRQAPVATPADVDSLLAPMIDSIVYEHPRARARLQAKAVLRQGMLNYLGTVRNARDSVLERATAAGVVVVVTQSRADALSNGAWVPSAAEDFACSSSRARSFGE